MREVGERLGAPAATVSQVEKGQRAMKEPKIRAWAAALEVGEADLHELWQLSQGWIPVGHGSSVFYIDEPEVYTESDDGPAGSVEHISTDGGRRLFPMRHELGSEPLRAEIVPTVRQRPGLEPVYRLAERIAAVMRRALPNASIQVHADQFEPPHIEKMAGGLTLTAAEEDENGEAEAAFVPLPLIECYWAGTPGRPEPSERRHRVPVPMLRGLIPVVRRRAKSVQAAEVEDLIRDLSGPERERVRGYIEAIVEQRADSES